MKITVLIEEGELKRIIDNHIAAATEDARKSIAAVKPWVA